ncbi:MAG: N-6 DNA methylase [Lentisphaeria bacterium]|nr:N-6 DNA methylase [Lentisphaeria bacterium]
MKLSQATQANWQRLKPDTANKLQRGANKTRSGRIIYPVEYLRNKKNLAFAEKVLHIARKNALSREITINSIAQLLLKKHNIQHKEHVKKVLADYSCQTNDELMALEDIPLDEWDILGFIYQCLQREGEKNVKGSYYTPEVVVKNMLANYRVAPGEKVLDPACGSGSFLQAMRVQSPEQLYGCDLDETAVFIAKVNLLCKYHDLEFTPQIYCCDFLAGTAGKIFEERFKYIAANPPWGAKNNQAADTPYGKIKDTFSLFLLKSYTLLQENGSMCFLLPKAVLNIKRHKNIREFLLNGCRLETIEHISGKFSGVMTDYISVTLCNAPSGSSFMMIKNDCCTQVNTADVRIQPDCVFCYKNKLDTVLTAKIDQQKKYDLAESIFALGIVTGDNKNKLFDTPQNNCEAIYTGKDVERYKLRPVRKYICYDRSKFQQTAPDEYYRAGEKLVYKFISKELVFAYDNSGSLILNSANMLIPQIAALSIKTVLALLNSEVLRYYYKVQFNDVKILKGNLIRLPLPEIECQTQTVIEAKIDELLDGNTAAENALQKLIYECYKLSEEDIGYIKSKL